MKLCIPISSDQGLNSPVNAHFGSTPAFLVYDSETGEHRVKVNANEHHAHGMCQPLAALAGENLDAIVVGGIGYGAMMKLQAAGLEVFLSEYPTVQATIEAMEKGLLKSVTAETACGHHGHGEGGSCHGNGMGFQGGRTR